MEYEKFALVYEQQADLVDIERPCDRLRRIWSALNAIGWAAVGISSRFQLLACSTKHDFGEDALACLFLVVGLRILVFDSRGDQAEDGMDIGKSPEITSLDAF